VNDNGQEVDAPNGFYEDGKIYIDLNAGNDGKGTMLFTVAHELTHFVKECSPAKFKILANLLVKDYTAKGQSVQELIDAQIAKAERSGRTIDEDEAFEEVVADSMESILTDGNVVEFMAAVKQQDQSLWEKIRQWFKDLAGDLRKLVDAYKGVKPDSKEGRMVSQMQDVIRELEKAYAEGLAEAGENFRAEEKTPPVKAV
jgi:predicted RNase H-like nuclease (RuvC/YqgF family)